MDKEFEEKHRQEIERVAFRIYQDQIRFGQEDDPVANWKRACEIVRSMYRVGDNGAQILGDYFRDRSTDAK